MKIIFEDDENVEVRIDASVVNNETGDCVEDGFLVYNIKLRIPRAPDNAPEFIYCYKEYEFVEPYSADYSVITVAAGLDDRYRIDDNGPGFSKIIEAVEEEWWTRFAEDHYDYVYGNMDEPAHWRSK